VHDGILGLVALGAAVSNYLKRDRHGMVATAANSKNQRPGAELVSQRRNLQVCTSDLEWGGVQVRAYVGGSKAQPSRTAWSLMFARVYHSSNKISGAGVSQLGRCGEAIE
jgi:hypothetical protein